MATCGYLCPSCSGTGYVDNEPCNWCQAEEKQTQALPHCSSDNPGNPQKLAQQNTQLSDEEWLKQVHEGPCCGDWK